MEQRLFRCVGGKEPAARAPIDLNWVHMELRRAGVTRQLLWAEYQQAMAAEPSGDRPYLVDREWTERENRRIGRRIKDAKLGMQACVEDLWCDPARGLDKSVARALGTCQWERAKQNVIVIGMTARATFETEAPLAREAPRQPPDSEAAELLARYVQA
ncbi:ATP-binding protein [Sorangium sp. So ce204]|uniref:ATP-binding protein n=1 Tax=Sorangium sp. So ce204 TaxID=3133288 RepID=UPI003F5DB633